MYYRGAAAAILVYDITREASFKTLQSWVEELQQKGPKEIALAIAGNKKDLEANRVRAAHPLIVLLKCPCSCGYVYGILGGERRSSSKLCRADRGDIHGDQCEGRHQCARRIH